MTTDTATPNLARTNKGDAQPQRLTGEHMNALVLTIFWLTAIGSVLRLFVMMFSEYPRTMTYSVGLDSAQLIVNIAFMAWAAYLLWGTP